MFMPKASFVEMDKRSGFFISQMGFSRHKGGGICNAVGQLCNGISCTGEKDQQIQKTFRTDRPLPLK